MVPLGHYGGFSLLGVHSVGTTSTFPFSVPSSWAPQALFPLLCPPFSPFLGTDASFPAPRPKTAPARGHHRHFFSPVPSSWAPQAFFSLLCPRAMSGKQNTSSKVPDHSVFYVPTLHSASHHIVPINIFTVFSTVTESSG